MFQAALLPPVDTNALIAKESQSILSCWAFAISLKLRHNTAVE